MPQLQNIKIGVVGLGYVGLPLALGLAEKFDVVGFDTSQKRVNELQHTKDINFELDQ